MTHDERVLDLLGVFHYVVGALMILGASIFLIHLAMGVAMVTGQFPDKDGPPQIMGWMFIALPALVILAGWTLAGFIIYAGRSLRNRTRHGLCLAMAGIECIFMPFGTVLGIFTLVTLMKEDVRLLFDSKGIGDNLVHPGRNGQSVPQEPTSLSGDTLFSPAGKNQGVPYYWNHSLPNWYTMCSPQFW